MIILFWCSNCRVLHPPAGVVSTDAAGATMVTSLCGRCGQPVAFRAIPDDPDDPNYGRPRCPTCRAEVRASSRFCPQCGAPQQTGPLPGSPAPTVGVQGGSDSAVQPEAGYQAARLLVQFARQRRRRQQIARILDALANPPNYRRSPLPGDLPGDFDAWFDGGAVNYLTSLTEYHFDDGARACIRDLALERISVEFPDGARVTIEETAAQGDFAGQVLAAVVAECRRILQSLQTPQLFPSAVRPPAQCILVEGSPADTGRPAQAWLYDLGTSNLVAHPVADADMSGEPVDGMYFRRGLIRYHVAEDRRTLDFSCTLGPRYGRGLRFELVGAPDGIRLERPELLWIS